RVNDATARQGERRSTQDKCGDLADKPGTRVRALARRPWCDHQSAPLSGRTFASEASYLERIARDRLTTSGWQDVCSTSDETGDGSFKTRVCTILASLAKMEIPTLLPPGGHYAAAAEIRGARTCLRVCRSLTYRLSHRSPGTRLGYKWRNPGSSRAARRRSIDNGPRR